MMIRSALCLFLFLLVTALSVPLISVRDVAAQPIESVTHSFDFVVPPAIPLGWSAPPGAGGNAWSTVNSVSYTSPNSIFAPNLPSVSDLVLVAPPFSFGTPTGPISFALHFAHRYNIEERSATEAWDGGVVEVSFNGGPFQDVIAAGGVFSANGYNRRVVSSPNPLNGRDCYSGSQTTFQTSSVKFSGLPASTSQIQFRWRLGTDDIVGRPGWWIDNVQIEPEVNLAVTTTNLGADRVRAGETLRFSSSVTNLSPFPVGSAAVAMLAVGFDLGDVSFERGILSRYDSRLAVVNLEPDIANPVLLEPGQSINIGFEVPTSTNRPGAGVLTFAPDTADERSVPIELTLLGASGGDVTLTTPPHFLSGDPCAPIPPSIDVSGKIVVAGEPFPPCTYTAAVPAIVARGASAIIFALNDPGAPVPSEVLSGVTIPVGVFRNLIPEVLFPFIFTTPPAALRLRFGSDVVAVLTAALPSSEANLVNSYKMFEGSVLLDTDGDGAFDVDDQCPSSALKTQPGACGCLSPDEDLNGNGALDCLVSPEFKARIAALRALVKKARAGTTTASARKLKQLRREIASDVASLRAYASERSTGILLASGFNLSQSLVDVKRKHAAFRRANASLVTATKKALLRALQKLERAILA